MDNCAVCKEDIKPGSVCPRCGSDNSGVKDITWGYFNNIWAIMSFLLILAPLFMLLPMVMSWVEGVFAPVVSVRVAAPISLLVTMVIAFYLFSMRDDMLEKNQSRTFQEKKGMSLPMRALLYFVAGVVVTFVLGFVVTSKETLIGPNRWQVTLGSLSYLLLLFVMTGFLVLMFAFFALATGHMAVYEFGGFAERNSPDPIYLNQRLMMSVVLRAVRRHIGNIRVPLSELENLEDAGNGQEIELFLIKMQRTPDAGMILQLHEKGVPRPEGEGDKKEIWLDEKRWLVEADLWARLIKVVEQEPRTVKVELVKPKPEPESETAKELKPADEPKPTPAFQAS